MFFAFPSTVSFSGAEQRKPRSGRGWQGYDGVRWVAAFRRAYDGRTGAGTLPGPHRPVAGEARARPEATSATARTQLQPAAAER